MLRRHSLRLGLALAVLAAVLAWLKPADRGAPHAPYFTRLETELKAHGEGRPALVLDLDRVDANAELLRKAVPAGVSLRIVAKSLPSVPLLAHLMDRLRTRKLMVFHAPDLDALAANFPDVDILMGKPMPLQAMRTFYAFPPPPPFDPSLHLQWLVDTKARLEQYLTVAQAKDVLLAINIEIDVGLHRGGVATPAELVGLLELISAHPDHLRLAGLMGYDAQVAHAPPVLSSTAKALADVDHRYAEFIAAGKAAQPDLFTGTLTYNGGGSQTFQLYDAASPVNEVAVGSALVKPTDFDVPSLAAYQPAAFIATPVLKRLPGTRVPFIEALSPLFSAWDPNRAETLFLYGGGWRAHYASPSGLEDNTVYGFSTNQAFVNASAKCGLDVDDWVFLQPTQSEEVLRQFGALWVVQGGKITERWASLSP